MIIPSATRRWKQSSVPPAGNVSDILFRMRSAVSIWPENKESSLIIKEPEPKASLISELVGQREVGPEIDTTTDHAWLVVLGHFGQELGLVRGLEGVALEQRRGPEGVAAQTKLIEFLVGILGGLEYLQELNQRAQPIAKDGAIVEAWGQKAFRHYSQVSRTLDAADEQTLQEVVEVLRQVSWPFIQKAVMETMKQQGQLSLDVDLTGRPVSPTSSDYDEADFGWMDDGISKGYQAAVTSLVNERWGRLMVSLQRYPGRTSSAECLQAAIREAEEVLQVRPRRRVELSEARRRELVGKMEQLQAKMDRKAQIQDQLWARIRAAKAEVVTDQAQLTAMERHYQATGRQERPHSRLAKKRRKLAASRKRVERAWRDLKKRQDQTSKLHRQTSQLQEQLLALDEWLAELETDNLSNLNPLPIMARIDAGFSSGSNLTWLIEMGYIVLTKAHHNSSTNSLRRHLQPQAHWSRVGKNAAALAMGAYFQNDCPYPLQAMLVRYHLPGKVRYTTLFYYHHSPPPALAAWFKLYNARQTIEAGIKEAKSVLTLKRHLVRSPIGMPLQEQFALFGANFVRWAAAWVKKLLSQTNHAFNTALGQVKTLVQTVSRTRARWVRNAVGSVLVFDQSGPFTDTIICLSGSVAIQLPLPLFNFAPP